MDAQACANMMKGKGSHDTRNGAKPTVHQATAVDKAADAANGKVTLSHGPVPSLNWPAMTMAFIVKDKHLFEKLVVGKTVDVELVKQGSDYVVTALK